MASIQGAPFEEHTQGWTVNHKALDDTAIKDTILWHKVTAVNANIKCIRSYAIRNRRETLEGTQMLNETIFRFFSILEVPVPCK
jgi:hypothetical protein